jgi:hypothetical protein
VVEVVTLIGAERPVVFDLELDVDVHAASVPGSDETATTSTGRRRLQLDDEVTFRARHLGVHWHLTSRVTEYDRPRRFVDEQTRGPFCTLRHEHVFDSLAGHRTRMTDRVSFTVPGGPAGRACARLLLAPYLRRLLRRRAHHVGRLAEVTTGPRPSHGPRAPRPPG